MRKLLATTMLCRSGMGAVLALALGVSLISGPAASQERRWSGAETGLWSVPGNWTPEGIPDADSHVFVDNAEVLNNALESIINRLVLGRQSGTTVLTIQDGALRVTGSDINNPNDIGQVPGSDATLSIIGSGGEFSRSANNVFPDMRIGVTTGSLGRVEVREGGALDVENIIVGANGEGQLVVTGFGTDGFAERMRIGDGDGGVGLVEFSNRAQFSAGVVTVGAAARSTGTLAITDDAFIIAGDILIGRGGSATVSVLDGGRARIGFLDVGLESGGVLVIGGETDRTARLNVLSRARVAAGRFVTGRIDLLEGGELWLGQTVGADPALFALQLGADPEGTALLNIGTGEGAGVLRASEVQFGDGFAGVAFDHTMEEYVFAPGFASVGSGGHTITLRRGRTALTGDVSGFSGSINVLRDATLVRPSGVLELAARPDQEGDLTIGAGGNAPGGLVEIDEIRMGAGLATINFRHGTNDYLFEPSVSGRGVINVGGGRNILSGDSSDFTGQTRVERAGAPAPPHLYVTGTLGGEIIVSDGGQFSDGVLGGTGTVGPVTVRAFGNISPGLGFRGVAADGLFAIGQLNVDGDIVFGSGSFFDVNVSGNDAADLLAVSGRAIIDDGAEVRVTALSPFSGFRNGQRFVILTAVEGVEGEFEQGSTLNTAFLAPRLEHGANDVTLIVDVIGALPDDEEVPEPVDPVEPVDPEPVEPVEPGPVDPVEPEPVDPVEPEPVEPVEPEPVEPVDPVEPEPVEPVEPEPADPEAPVILPTQAQTPNQLAAARALDRAVITPGSDAEFVDDQLLLLSGAEARRAFDLASGEVHASGQHVIGQSFGMFSRLLRQQAQGGAGRAGMASFMAASRGELASRGRGYHGQASGTAWISPLGARGRIDGDGNAAPLDWRSTGLAAGYDRSIESSADSTRVGFGLGYIRSRGSVDDRLSNFDVAGFHMGAYAGWVDGPWRLSGSLAYAESRVSVQRRIAFGAIDRIAESDYRVRSLGFSGEAGYAVDIGNRTTLMPFATLDALHARHGGFVETGAGALDLTGAAQSWRRLDAGIGLGFSHVVPTATGTLVLEGRIAWEHALVNTAPTQTVSLASNPATFQVQGRNTGRNSARVGAGLAWELSSDMTLRAGYEGVFSGGHNNHAATVRFNWRF